jgi:hypothetical protein
MECPKGTETGVKPEGKPVKLSALNVVQGLGVGWTSPEPALTRDSRTEQIRRGLGRGKISKIGSGSVNMWSAGKDGSEAI